MGTTPGPFGHYELVALVGVGGMGEVWRARDTRRDRWVALKLLPGTLGDDDEFLHRFRRESHVAARLREPHVIPIHDFGEIDGRPYIDMRLVDGRDLGSLLRDGPIAPRRAVALVAQAAEALEAAHDDGLVHRDVKPSNILVTPSDFVYVVDFGIARSVGHTSTSLTLSGATVGTLDYMAPERFTNQPVDGRVDVYSLACVLAECLTGSRPFAGEDLASLLYAHLYTDPPRPSRSADGVPVALDDVVARGMAKRAQDRYPTPTALVAAARAALDPPTAVPGGRSPGTLPAPARPDPDARPPSPTGGTRSLGGALPPAGTEARAEGVGDGLADELLTATTGAHRRDGAGDARRRRGVLVAAAAAAALAAGTAAWALWPGGGTASPGAGGGTPGPATGGSVDAPAAGPSAVPTPAVEPAASIAVPTISGDPVPVGATPGFLAVAPNGRYAYIANRDEGVVTVLDTTSDAVTATIPVPDGPPQFIAFSPDGRVAYVTLTDADHSYNAVAFIDTATNQVTATVEVGLRPFAPETSPDGRLLYVPLHDEGRVEVLDTATAEEVDSYEVPRNPHWIAVSDDGREAWTANHESGVVSLLDLTDGGRVVTSVPTGLAPHSIAYSPDGSRVAVVNFESSTLSILDAATRAVVADIPVGTRPQDVTFAPDGRHLYTANVEADTVSVVDTVTGRVTADVPTGDGPTSVGVLPDGRKAYVTNLDDGTVRVLDIAAV